jgi:hypothetical protein
VARSKAKRTSYHVVPDREGPADGRWQIKEEGRRPRQACRTQRQAISAARTEAKARQPSQVIVHGRDGRIRTEYTYGDDPRRTPG